jgi:hypothetical protein
MALLLTWTQPVAAERLAYVIGDSVPDASHAWRQQGNLDRVDDTAEPGWIMPLRISSSQNILHELYQQQRLFAAIGIEGRVLDPNYRTGDGRLWSPNLSFAERESILRIANGLRDTSSFDSFNRLQGNLGVTIYADLGSPFPVSQVRFTPLRSGVHADRFIKGYELFSNNGADETQDAAGNPIYTLLSAVPTNVDVAVADSSFPPQHVRFLKLRITKEGPFEIDQLEVRGEGYLGHATFVSRIIDLRDVANFGVIRWKEEVEEGADVQVQSRVGVDATALRYFRGNDLGLEEELQGATDEDNQRDWLALPAEMRGAGGMDDEENWSRWSAPYAWGERIRVQGPRRYVQVRVIMRNATPLVKARLDQVQFEYSQPTYARSVFGQVSPARGVDLGQTRLLSYTLRPVMSPAQDQGFDLIEIDTPSGSTVQGVSVAGRELTVDEYQVEAAEHLLRIRLAGEQNRVRAEQDLVVRFETTILSYGTILSGRVGASWAPDDLLQDVEEARSGDLTVRGSLESLGQVVSELAARPNPFTPNGDRRNDVTFLSFKVFQVVGRVPLSLAVYDLAGGCVRTGFEGLPGEIETGEFAVPWDGLDEQGRLVPPGLYLVRASVDGDTGRFSRIMTVTVLY